MSKPWLTEPDRKEWTAHGFPCLIIRQRSGGHLCGYVGVSKGHPAYEQSYSDSNGIINDLSVHGGITFNEHGAGMYPGGFYWIGFDCAHSGDFSPLYHKKYGFDFDGETYKDMDYVTEETENLAEQLAAMLTVRFRQEEEKR